MFSYPNWYPYGKDLMKQYPSHQLLAIIASPSASTWLRIPHAPILQYTQANYTQCLAKNIWCQ